MAIENGVLKPSGVLQLKGGTYEVLSAVNPYLARRELVVETDTGKIKVGDGLHHWNELPYAGCSSSGTTIVSQQVSVTVLGVANEPVVIPASGDQYIVGDEPTGDFEGAEAGNIARYNGFAWEFLTPSVGGLEVINISNGQILRYTGGQWICVASLAIWNGEKVLESLMILETEKYVAEVGDTWDFSNVRVIAQYSDGIGMDVTSLVRISPGIGTDVTPMVSYSPAQDEAITKDGNYEITASYTYGGRTATNTFSRYVIGTNDCLPYITTSSDRMYNKLWIGSLNVSAIQNDKPENIYIYNTIRTGDIIRNVIIGGNSTNNTSVMTIAFTSSSWKGNICFPSEEYNFSSSSRIVFGRPNTNVNQAYFNGHIDFPNGLRNCQSTFLNCWYFNSPVNIPDTVTNCSSMFSHCYNFNSPVYIGNNVEQCDNMFFGCTNFNQEVIIPDTVTNCSSMFSNCYNFNSPVYIGNNVNQCNYMFFGCNNFNQEVIIPENVTSCYGMFRLCNNFNQPVVIPNSVTNALYMFYCANKFNSALTIGAKTKTTCAYNSTSSTYYPLLVNCRAIFNAPVTFNYGVQNCFRFFYNMPRFNQPITIPCSVINAKDMFFNCVNMSYNVHFSSGVTDCYAACSNCLNISDIFINRDAATNVVGLVGSSAQRKNAVNDVTIHCPNLAIINKTTINNSVINAAITWDDNWYNSLYKIQLTTDMTGYDMSSEVTYQEVDPGF